MTQQDGARSEINSRAPAQQEAEGREPGVRELHLMTGYKAQTQTAQVQGGLPAGAESVTARGHRAPVPTLSDDDGSVFTVGKRRRLCTSFVSSVPQFGEKFLTKKLRETRFLSPLQLTGHMDVCRLIFACVIENMHKKNKFASCAV